MLPSTLGAGDYLRGNVYCPVDTTRKAHRVQSDQSIGYGIQSYGYGIHNHLIDLSISIPLRAYENSVQTDFCCDHVNALLMIF